MAIADRQNAASLPAHLVLHAIELKGYATGEGAAFDPTGSAAHSLGFRGASARYERVAADIDRPAAHVTHQRLSSILLSAAGRAYVERQLRVRFALG